jgi:hypothetical protein
VGDIKHCIGNRITLMGGYITLINSDTSLLSNVPRDISAIGVGKSMPNTVISFNICSGDFDTILEISDLGLVVGHLGIDFRHPIIQPLDPLLHVVYILQEALACLIPIGVPLSGRSVFRASHGSFSVLSATVLMSLFDCTSTHSISPGYKQVRKDAKWKRQFLTSAGGLGIDGFCGMLGIVLISINF